MRLPVSAWSPPRRQVVAALAAPDLREPRSGRRGHYVRSIQRVRARVRPGSLAGRAAGGDRSAFLCSSRRESIPARPLVARRRPTVAAKNSSGKLRHRLSTSSLTIV